jgi:hypothetical protein
MSRPFRIMVRSDREGQTLAVVAISVVALLAIMSLGIDLGMAYTARAEAQRVADSAALAGASAFLDYSDPLDAENDAEDRARDYAARNVVRNRPVHPLEDVDVQVLPAEQKVRVWVRRTGLPVWFARLLGQDQLNVRAMAAAQAIAAGSSACVKPFAIPDRWEENSGDDFIRPEEGIMDSYEILPCAQGNRCGENELWEFNPTEGDIYRPANQMTGEAAWGPEQATSWGSKWRDPQHLDGGARLLITPGHAKGASTPGWYQYWKLPDTGATCSNPGTQCLKENIKQCINLGDLGIGDSIVVDETLEQSSQPADGSQGNRGKPIFDAVVDELISKDPDIAWDHTNRQPYYPDGRPASIWDSPRVITVVLVHPGDIRPGNSSMRIADLATVFLEDPQDLRTRQGGPDHHLPITGRLFHYGGGTPGSAGGQLQKYLRLVE